MIKSLISFFMKPLLSRKGHNELGIAPYVALASFAGFVVMRVRLLWQKRKVLAKG